MILNVIAKLRGTLSLQTVDISKALSVSVLNQAISSGNNFIFGFYLVHILTPAEFGLYGIGFAISLFYTSIGNALFLTQMVVRVPDKSPVDRLPYAARILTVIVAFCFITSFVISMLIYCSSFFSAWIQQYAELGFAIIMASISCLVKDFFVRHSYTVRKEIWALWVNICVGIALGCFVTARHFTGEILYSTSSVWLYALSNISGSLAGLFLAGLPFKAVRFNQLKRDCSEAWSGGKWDTATTCFYFLRTQAHILITASMLGPVAVAYLNATRLLVTPAVVLIPALSQVFLPRLATLSSSNPQKVIKIGALFSATLCLITIIYSIFLLVFLQDIMRLAFGSKYECSFILVLSWCFSTIFLSLRSGTEMVFQVLKKFRFLTVVNIISGLVAIVSVYALVKSIGISGAISGLVIGEAVLISLLWWKSSSCL
jgi:O-antigen/teichoic acid export membrane protein